MSNKQENCRRNLSLLYLGYCPNIHLDKLRKNVRNLVRIVFGLLLQPITSHTQTGMLPIDHNIPFVCVCVFFFLGGGGADATVY
jgi:hypothetical protein